MSDLADLPKAELDQDAPVGRIILSGGKVLVEAAPWVLDQDARLQTAGHRAALTPVPGFGFALPVPQILPVAPREDADYVLRVNALQEWHLDDAETAQIEIISRRTAVQVPLIARTRVQPGKEGLRFKALIACHRANARLRVTVQGARSGERREMAVPFDPVCIGGKDPAGYQQVSLALPVLAEETWLSVDLLFLPGADDPSVPWGPFLFVARPQIVAAEHPSGLITPLALGGPALPGAIWLQATVPHPDFAAGADLDLVYGGNRRRVFTAVANRVEARRSGDGALSLRAEHPVDLVMWVDGVPAFAIGLTSTFSRLRVPLRFQGGPAATLQLFDRHGVQLFWQDQIVWPQHRAEAPRVLFIDQKTPAPQRDAGSFAAVNEMKLVQAMGYSLTFLPSDLEHCGAQTRDLEAMGVEVITAPDYQTPEEYLDECGSLFDVIYITRYHVANRVMQAVRSAAPQAKVILNAADLHFLRELRAALHRKDAGALARMAEVRRQELGAMRRADLILSYSPVEQVVIQSHIDGAVPVMTCPWLAEFPASVPPRDGRYGLSFLGNFGHHPNLEGLEWFAEAVMPDLHRLRPEIGLTIYGAGMTAQVEALRREGIDPVGYLQSADAAYDRHRIFVAPLLSGAGIKGKVVAALARGTPCILTSIAAEGLDLRDGLDCLIADSPEDWLQAIPRLYDDATLWQTLSQASRAHARSRFSIERGVQQMRAAFARAKQPA